MDPVTAIVLVGGGAFALSQSKDAKATQTATKKFNALDAGKKKAPGIKGAMGRKEPLVVAPKKTGVAPAGTQGAKEVQDALAKKAKEEYEKLSAEAKTQVCIGLKKEFPNDPHIQQINCNQPTYQQIAAGVGAAAAAAGCAATGAGATLAGICGTVGAKIGPYVAKYGKEAYEETKEFVEDAAQEVWDGAKSGFGLW